MLRYLILNFSKKSTISSIKSQFTTKHLSQSQISYYHHKFINPNNSHDYRYLTSKVANADISSTGLDYNLKSNSVLHDQQNPFDSDEYLLNSENIVKIELARISKKDALNEIKNAFMISDKQAQDLFAHEMKFKKSSFAYVPQTVKLLLNHFTKETVIENPWILTLRPKLLQSKIDILQIIQPRDINDFIPFFKISASRLLKLTSFLRKDSKNLPKKYENRIYYISDRLNLDPKLVTKHLSRRQFILFMPWESLEQNLNNMIEYGVEPISILKDLWAFRYTPHSVKARLQRVTDAKKDKVMPWMVRCPERVLERTLKLSLDERNLLGDMDSIVEYVSYRLGYDIESTKAIMYKHPAVLRVRVTKVKDVLDYLLNDAKIEPYEIAQVPRILCHGLATTKIRFEELKSYGCRPSSLVILCRTRREYQKFVDNWLAIHEKLKNKDNVKVINDI